MPFVSRVEPLEYSYSMTLPNFIVLGAAKAGTTAVYHYLNQHPQVYVSPLKETNFFALEGEPLAFAGPGDDAYVNRLSITSLPAYEAQFDGVRGETAIGEASPLYLYSARAAERIHAHAPDAQLIAIVRNPVYRAYSAFLHVLRDQREDSPDFRTALAREDERIAMNWEHIWHYKRMGLYYEQLQRYYDAFPAEQITVYLYKDLRTDPQAMISSVFRLLNVDDTFQANLSQRHNTTSELRGIQERYPLLPEVRSEMRAFFREDTLRLQDLIGRDLTHWLSDNEAEGAAEMAAMTSSSG